MRPAFPSLIGMIHLPPLPGSPANRWPLARICQQACRDARALADAGFDAVIIENFGDAPFRPDRVDPHTVACMTAAAEAVSREIAIPVGINALRNDPIAALAVAAACGAAFIRVNVHVGACLADQGILQGRADETLRFRRRIGCQAAVLADVHVKHARPLAPQPIAEAAEETAYRGRADGLIVSGPATGRPAAMEDLRAVRAAVPDRPLLVGSGASAETVRDLLTVADGVIVGTAIKYDACTTSPVDPDRAAAFVAAARSRS